MGDGYETCSPSLYQLVKAETLAAVPEVCDCVPLARYSASSLFRGVEQKETDTRSDDVTPHKTSMRSKRKGEIQSEN